MPKGAECRDGAAPVEVVRHAQPDAADALACAIATAHGGMGWAVGYKVIVCAWQAGLMNIYALSSFPRRRDPAR